MIAFLSFPHALCACGDSMKHASRSFFSGGTTNISSINSSFIPRTISLQGRRAVIKKFPPSEYSPSAILGGGGFLGVGPAEVVVIIAVGWLLLGPEKLYTLAKDSGKLLGELRRTADEARTTFTDALETEITTKQEEKDKLLAKDEPKSLESTSADSNGSLEDEHEEITQFPSPDFSPTSLSSPEDNYSEISSHQEVEQDTPNPQFQDQLKRVSDPDQLPPSGIPDLDLNVEMEEEEVERLEKQYLEARNRLQARKEAASPNRAHELNDKSDVGGKSVEQSDANSKGV